jgi:hypothetical protein
MAGATGDRPGHQKRRGGMGKRSDDDGPSDAEIVAMTIRHGADYAKRYCDRLYVTQGHAWDDDAERLRMLASDLGGDPQAEILPFTPREPKP